MTDTPEMIPMHLHREFLEMAKQTAARDARRGQVSLIGMLVAVLLAGLAGWLLGQKQVRDEYRAANPIANALAQYARGCR